MTTRTTRKTVRFEYPFTLAGAGTDLPPRDYDIETDEERLEGTTLAAYRRTSTLIYLSTRPGTTQIVPIEPDDLEAALCRDRAAIEASGKRSTRAHTC